jgi:hypothetical protein
MFFQLDNPLLVRGPFLCKTSEIGGLYRQRYFSVVWHSYLHREQIRNDPKNTSDYRTVTADIILEQNTSAEGKSNTVSSENRCVPNVKWDKVNIVEYKEIG